MWELSASQSENFRVFVTPFTLSSYKDTVTLFDISIAVEFFLDDFFVLQRLGPISKDQFFLVSNFIFHPLYAFLRDTPKGHTPVGSQKQNEDYHYVLRMLKTFFWDSRCQTYVFKTKIA